MKIMNIYTDEVETIEQILDLNGYIYNVEYVPSTYNKVDHFGEVYSDNLNQQTQFSFFNEEEFSEIKLLLNETEIKCQIEEIETEVIDYQQQFEDDYPVIMVGNFIITPPWKKSDEFVDDVLVIAPSTGFGTGQSPTTQLCLKWISDKDFSDQTVLDFGSGSGILAIAAAKRKAQQVIALEIDEIACESARNHVEMNDCQSNVEVMQTEQGHYDVLIMNVTTPIFKMCFDDIWPRVKKCGYISGVRDSEYNDVCDFFEKRKIKYISFAQDEWHGFEVER